MMIDLKPYPEARTITLPWLQTVPRHWDVRRIKTLLREHDRRTKTGEERLLSLRMREGIVDHLESGGKPARPTDLIGYKIVEPGVLIMNRMRASSGLFGVASIGGLVSPDYATFRPDSSANTSYLLYLFKTPMLAEVFRAESRGLGTGEAGFLRLYTDRFGAIEIPVPPIEEQQLIVRFLDTHGTLTARLIRAKQRLIKLLEEQKQAIIHRAVTRGLDPNVRLKPSGVPWLGDIPEHWDVVHLRYLVRCLDGQRVPLNGTQRGAMQGPFPYWGANRIIDHVNSWLFDEDLVLLGEDGAPFFEAGRDVSFAVSGKIWINNHAHVLKCKPRVSSSFLATTLNCVDYRNFIDGSTRDKLTQQAMGSIPIQVPEVLEQRRIVDQVDQETSDLRHALRVLHGEISLIRELRSAVIADIVTGKLNVRAAALALPEVTESEPIDEPTDGEDLEEAIDDVEDEVVAA